MPQNQQQEPPDDAPFSMTVTFFIGPMSSTAPQPTSYTRRNLRPLRHRLQTEDHQHAFEEVAMEEFRRLAPLLLLNMIFGLPEDTHMQGQPRASDASIDSLQILTSLSEKRRLKHIKCAICQEEFTGELPQPDNDQSVARLPCHHLFHKACISHWLKISCTCPSCRYELLTENEDYNVGVRERMAQRDSELALDTDDEEYHSQKSSRCQQECTKKRKLDEDNDNLSSDDIEHNAKKQRTSENE
jgi:hypothetical protein